LEVVALREGSETIRFGVLALRIRLGTRKRLAPVTLLVLSRIGVGEDIVHPFWKQKETE